MPFFSVSNLEVQNINAALTFNGDDAYTYVEDQLDIGFRIPGTQERVDCANYFISKFMEIESNFTTSYMILQLIQRIARMFYLR